MNRRQKIIVSITGIFIVLLALVGLTYAYFLTRITGNKNEKSISVTTANLELVYGDGNGSLEPYGTITPGDPIKFLNTKGTETTNDDEEMIYGLYPFDGDKNSLEYHIMEVKMFNEAERYQGLWCY